MSEAINAKPPVQHNSNSAPTVEGGLWLFLLADMCIFALYFCVFLWGKAQWPEQYIEGQASLNTYFGGFNMLVLLVSSWFMATAVHAARAQDVAVYRRSLMLTLLCGGAFLMVKGLEYAEKFSAGVHIASNVFYRNYFAFTGIHMLHVILGMSLLSYLLFSVKNKAQVVGLTHHVEGVGLYWHMVDLLWVVLFSLIYLVP